MTRSDKWKQRPAVMRYRAFCDELRLKVTLVSNKTLAVQTGAMILTFGIPFAKSATKKFKEAHLNKPHQQKPDIDNLAKAILDALYTEDSHIHELHARKLWANEGYIVIDWV